LNFYILHASFIEGVFMYMTNRFGISVI